MTTKLAARTLARRSRSPSPWVGSLVLGALWLAHLRAPLVASACGGFFCSTTPIDQSAERVVYAYEADGSLTMAVEIRYSGEDDDFAWILPVPVAPTVSLGTSALFDALDAVTRPQFLLEERTDGTCRIHPRCVREDGTEPTAGSCGGGTAMAGGEDFVDTPAEEVPPLVPDAPEAPAMGVTVFSRGPVGPYETVVLGAATAVEVVDWLVAHGYQTPSATAALLEPYAAQGHVFVALRLRGDSPTRVLRPIVLRSAPPEGEESEACLPIRLTPVASARFLPITAFFLGDRLVAARNYSLAEPDLAAPGLFRGVLSYQATVAAAADAAGGQAFATDYAGRMPLLTLTLPSVGDLADETDPAAFVRTLVARGYRGDALLLEVLSQGLVPPARSAPTDYYNCLATASTLACGRPTYFDPAGLAALIETEIAAPRAEAQALSRRHTRLTRLSTELSPPEMTVDPVFVRDDGLPAVDHRHRGTLVRRCSPEYFRADAPVDLVVGTNVSTWQAGTVTTDAEYCSRFGAEPADGLSASGAAAECGYGCSVVGASTIAAPWLVLAGLLALRRRTSSRR